MQDLKKRTKLFALGCFHFAKKVPRSRELDSYVRQLIRSSSSVGANYRAAQRAKSQADFINKLKIVEEEVDESSYWLELFQEILESDVEEMKSLHKESKEILAIMVSSINTAKRNKMNNG